MPIWHRQSMQAAHACDSAEERTLVVMADASHRVPAQRKHLQRVNLQHILICQVT
jgi:hypothetical protein